MNSSWQMLTLGDSLDLLIDNRGKNPPYVETGVPCISGKSVTDQGLDLAKSRFIDERTWHEWMPQPMRTNDVILTSEAPLGRPALVRTDDPIALAQRVFGLRGKKDVLDSRFLYYSLFTKRVQADLLGRATGSTVVGIRQPALKAVKIPAPRFREQQSIAEVLGALDNKIASNTNLYRIIDNFLAASFARITRASPTRRLGEVAFVNPETCKPLVGGSLRYIDISSVGQGFYDFPEVSSWSEAPSRARRQVSRGDTLWSTVRPNRRSHALNLSTDELLVGSTGLAVLRPQGVGYAYFYESTKTQEFSSYLENVAEGSAYPAVRANRFEDAPILWAPSGARESFELNADPLRKMQHRIELENRHLATTRDVLLPQLMSGQLHVKDAETLIESVV